MGLLVASNRARAGKPKLGLRGKGKLKLKRAWLGLARACPSPKPKRTQAKLEGFQEGLRGFPEDKTSSAFLRD